MGRKNTVHCLDRLTLPSLYLLPSLTMADMASPEEAVLYRKQGRVAIVTLNQPKKLNAMTQPYYYRVSCLLREIAEDPDVSDTARCWAGDQQRSSSQRYSEGVCEQQPRHHAVFLHAPEDPDRRAQRADRRSVCGVAGFL